MPQPRFVVADLNGRNVGEPIAKARAFSIGMNRVESAGFTIRHIDPLWEQIAAGESMLKIYDQADALCFYGPIIATQEDAQGQGATYRCTAADMAWRLGRRFVGKDTNQVGTPFTATDSGTIVYTLLATLNAEFATGISEGTKDTFVTRTVTFLWKRMLDVIAELGSIANSYEWALRYVDGTPPTVYLDLRTRLGTDRTSSLFLEYGTGLRNCRAYTLATTLETLATDVYVQAGNQTLTSLASDVDARNAYRRHEDVISYGDITSSGLLDALAAAHVAIRRYPRDMIEITPFPKTSPRFGIDWFVGDTATVRVVVGNRTRVSGALRIYGADITLSDTGEEVPTLRLAPE